MSAREFAEWMAYEKVTGPIGPERLDIHVARLMAQTYNTNRPKGKKPEKPKAFMPDWDARPQTAEDMLAMVRMLNAIHGGEVRDGSDN